MTYSITIGNREPASDPDQTDRWDIAPTTQPHAPNFTGDYRPRANNRMPDFYVWDALCWDHDLTPIFYDTSDWTRHDPSGKLIPPDGKRHLGRHARDGVFELTREHYQLVHDALQRLEARYPNSTKPTPGWGARQDDQYARLLWLDWWMAWALENCERPGYRISY